MTTTLPDPDMPADATSLAALLIQSALTSRLAHRTAQREAAEERNRAQKEEVEKMHDEADAILANGLVSGAMQIGASAVKFSATMDSNEADFLKNSNADNKPGLQAASGQIKSLSDSASAGNLDSELLKTEGGLADAMGKANEKDLEADGKDAARRAGNAKDDYDSMADAARADKDLQDAIMKAYEALAGASSHNLSVILAPRG